MKKTKLILFTLVAAMMLMGAGYAYWTDTLTINNTVSTGNLDVKISSLGSGDYDNLTSSDAFTKDKHDKDYVNNLGESSSISELNNSKTLEFTNKNIYPGSGFWLRFQIENTGTVPVKLKDIGLVTGGDSAIEDDFRYTIGDISLYKIVEYDNGDKDSSRIRQLHNGESSEKEFETLSGFTNKLQEKLKNDNNGSPIILMPGESLVVGEGNALTAGYDIYLREDIGNETQDKDFNFTLQFNFTQHNAPNN